MIPKRLLYQAAVLICVVAPSALAKNDKPIMPSYVLTAHTVSVVIDPDAGISLDDPRANEVAQKDVESALLSWGRFNPVLSTQQADLIIVVRKGQKKLAEERMHDPRANSRPGAVIPGQDGVSIGGQHGSQPGQSSDGSLGSANAGSGVPSQVEVGNLEDSFTVYEENVENPTQGPFAWRWIRKDGLHPHDVPAVEEFRKALAEAEKQAAKQAAKHP